MFESVMIRPTEDLALSDLFRSVSVGPAALVVEGEPGIGKTTFWLSGLDRAREEGFRVLSACAAAAESVMAYTSLADMLGDCDPSLIADLPAPQRNAVDQILLRGDVGGAATDQRTLGAAFVSVVTELADRSPVLLAIDDLQWLDSSSRYILAFAVRRLPARVGVFVTVRTDPSVEGAASWLSIRYPAALRRVEMGPLSLSALHKMLSQRLGRTFSRPGITHIHEVSGGNPFYALELARATGGGRINSDTPLPATLSDLVRTRIGGTSEAVQEALLAAACDGAPTVDLVARVTRSSADRLAGRLEDAEEKGIIALDGERLRFTHPLLAKGVYAGATAAHRRSMHRRLAAVVDEPERRARHLALAAVTGDSETLDALDVAAESARIRGAPAAAAELLELALTLGGDTPERRTRLAGELLSAGDVARARVLLEGTIDRLPAGTLRCRAMYVLARLHHIVDSFLEAIDLLRRAIDEAGDDHGLKAQCLLPLSFALMNVRQLPAAIAAVEDAARLAERIADDDTLGQALAFLVGLRMIAGDGLDEVSLRRAVELGDDTTSVPVQFRPSMVNALVLGWTGKLHEAHRSLRDVRRRCIDRGEESELIYVAFHAVLVEVWRGDLTEAALVADDCMERALQLGGDLPLAVALSTRCVAEAIAGRTTEAEADALEAIAISQRCGFDRLAEWPIATLGFISVSVGDYERALTALQPLVTRIEALPRATELFIGSSIPDAAEAMIHLGRLDEAARLIDFLESNGTRLERAWMLAVGARCRAMLLASQGDLGTALTTAQAAMSHHNQVPMPFDRARSLLLVGQLLRRRRQKKASASAIGEALTSFEEMGSSVWADRARSELSRAKVSREQSSGLTASERRVADLAASGLRNRDIAATLFISPKTVEVNLSRVYRKLDIRSRAELGRHL